VLARRVFNFQSRCKCLIERPAIARALIAAAAMLTFMDCLPAHRADATLSLFVILILFSDAISHYLRRFFAEARFSIISRILPAFDACRAVKDTPSQVLVCAPLRAMRAHRAAALC